MHYMVTIPQGETINEKIDRFEAHARSLSDAAVSIENLKQNWVASQLILFSVIDRVSKVVSASKANNARFKETVKKYSQWDSSDKSSLYMLHTVLHHLKSNSLLDDSFMSLYQWCEDEKKKLFIPPFFAYKSHAIPTSLDPLISELEKQWPHDANSIPLNIATKSEIINIWDFNHLNLLWAHRNKVTHQLLSPSEATHRIKIKEDDNSYYQYSFRKPSFPPQFSLRYSENDSQYIVYHLAYPVYFIKKIADNIIKNSCEEMKKQQINPFSMFIEPIAWHDWNL